MADRLNFKKYLVAALLIWVMICIDALAVMPVRSQDGTPQATPSPRPNPAAHDNLCVGIASDSNGYGHVTFQIPDDRIVIAYVTPLWVFMQQALIDAGMIDLGVIDGSLSAGALTGIDQTDYLRSVPYTTLLNAHCAVVTVGPFIPDVAAAKAIPYDYIANLRQMVAELIHATPDGKILILSHYQTVRADFTVSNSGAGLTADRIAAFNAALFEACASRQSLGGVPQVTCIDTAPFFADFGAAGQSYVLGTTSKADYEASLFRRNGYSHFIDDYWAQHPDGALIGDGIHLNRAGRIRFTRELAKYVAVALGRTALSSTPIIATP